MADETRTAVTPELVTDVHQGGELVPVSGGGLAPIAHRPDALQIIQRQGEIFQAVQGALLRLTNPEDWTAQRVDGADHLTPSGTAVNKIRQYLALEVEVLERQRITRPVTVDGVETQVPGVQVTFRARSLVYGSLTGLEPLNVPWIQLSTTRWADEDFTGRRTDATGAIVRRGGVQALSSDLDASADSAARNRAFRQITGLDKVPVSVGASAWGLSAEKVLARAKKGYGFGSGSDRNAQGVAEEGVAADAKKLWDECLRQAGGDVAGATAILQEITSYPAWENKQKGTSGKAFAGNTSWQQLTKPHFVSKAWEKLRAREERQPGAGAGDQ